MTIPRKKPVEKRSKRSKKSEKSQHGNTLGSLERILSNSPTEGSATSGVHPSRGALKRFSAIPLLFGDETDRRATKGRVAYDSWEDGPAVSMRDVSDGFIRRLTLKAGRVKLELVAERRQNRWEFVARVYRSGQVAHGYVLKAGSRKMLAKSGGYFCWSDKSVPHLVELVSAEEKLAFERLTWQ